MNLKSIARVTHFMNAKSQFFRKKLSQQFQQLSNRKTQHKINCVEREKKIERWTEEASMKSTNADLLMPMKKEDGTKKPLTFSALNMGQHITSFVLIRTPVWSQKQEAARIIRL